MDINIKAVNPLQNDIIKPLNVFQSKEDDDEAVTNKLNKITAKLKSGKRLSAEEKSFLMKHSPALYQTARRVEIQRDALKEQLKHAKSKEEVNNIIGDALGGVSKKDPDVEYVVAGLQDEAKSFKTSSSYDKLPATDKDAKKDDVYLSNNKKKDKEAEPTGMYGKNGHYV